MNKVTELLQELEEDFWELLRLERDITILSRMSPMREELLKRYRQISVRVFGQVRQDRKED